MEAIVTPALQEWNIATMKKINACADEGKEWDKGCLIYASPKDAPLVTCATNVKVMTAPFFTVPRFTQSRSCPTTNVKENVRR